MAFIYSNKSNSLLATYVLTIITPDALSKLSFLDI